MSSGGSGDTGTGHTNSSTAKPKLPFYTQFVCGGLAGVSVDCILFPLDTIKTRLQVRRTGGTGAAAAPTNLYRNFYNGLAINCVGSFLSSGMFWTVYEHTKRTVLSTLPRDPHTGVTSEKWLPAGSVAGAAVADITACMIRVPFEVIKQRLQARLHTSTLSAIRNVVSTQGVAGLYAGFRATVIRELPFDAIEFTLYEVMKHRYCMLTGKSSAAEGVPAVPAMVLGGIAGGVAAGITTPFDTVKTRLMTQPTTTATTATAPTTNTAGAAASNTTAAAAASTTTAATATARRYTGVIDVLSSIVREEGPRALFRGITPRVMWITVGGSIYFGTYEKLVQYLGPKQPTAAEQRQQQRKQ